MKTNVFSMLMLIFAIMLWGCDNAQDLNDDSSKNYPVVLRTNDLIAPNGCNDYRMEADTLYVVNSQEELLALTSCTDNISDINWKNQTLLVTWDRRCNVDSKTLEKKFEEIAENVFCFQITVIPSSTANASPLILYTIVPKLPKNAIIGFNIILQNEENSVAGGLKGVSWKLDGFVDVATAKLTEAEPKNCKECYTLYFNTDSTFTGMSSVNEIYGEFIVNVSTSAIRIVNLGGTKIGETPDGNKYMDCLEAVHSFSLTETELKLYCNDGKEYLLYKKKTK
ncbi:MAG: META domain-containing protein [Dysgonamonadaceae bacterium]|jgi:hypothetical protein|nr:META domain-containing protein [Dysgonamonadaceae bacterium]